MLIKKKNQNMIISFTTGDIDLRKFRVDTPCAQ